jgi:hypothetical protein
MTARELTQAEARLAQAALVRRRWKARDAARTAHMLALAMLAEYDVTELDDGDPGWLFTCGAGTSCGLVLPVRDRDRAPSAADGVHADARRFALRCAVDHYVNHHPEG